MTWKNGRQLATYSHGSTLISFEYNDEGIRTTKTMGGTVYTYHLNGSQIVAEEWENKLLVYLYDASGSPIGMQYRTTSYAEGVFDTYWFEKNLQGDIVAVYNDAGTLLAKYTYDAWGNTVSTTYSNGGASTIVRYNRFRYRGYYYDNETGFYYLNSRYYDPVVGRFVNADDTNYLGVTGTVLSYNLYSYCENDPVNNDDLTGRGPFLAVGVQFVFTYKRFTIGIEFLWSTKNGKFYLFLFAGGINSRDINDVKSQKGNLLKKIANKVFQKSTNTKKKMLNILAKCGLSVSFVCVFGNKNVSFPSSYCGWFNNGSLSIRHFAVSGAFSRKENRFIGSFSFGATISTQKFSVGFSKTYYLQLTGDKALENNMNNWDDYIYDQIKWLSVFALPIY